MPLSTKIDSKDAPSQIISTGTINNQRMMNSKLDEGSSQFSLQEVTDLSCIVAGMPAIVYTYTVNHDTGESNFPFISDYCQEIFGLPASKIREDSEAFVNLVHPDDVNEFAASVLSSMINLTTWDFKMRMKDKDSRIVYIHGKSIPQRREITNQDGSVTKITVWNGVLFDITNRYDEKHFGKPCCQASVEASSNIQRHFDLPCFTMDNDGMVLSWNTHMTKLTRGILEREAVGENLMALVPNNEQGKNDVMRLLDRGCTSCVCCPSDTSNDVEDDEYYSKCSQDLTFLSKTGHDIYIRLNYTKDGTKGTVSCTCEDITELKEAEKQKMDALRLLDAEKNLTEWLAHEIRNPLTIALEAADSLRHSEEKNNEASSFQKICNESESFVELITNSISYVVDVLSKMLDLNKIVEGKIALRPSICSLREDIFEPITQMMNVRKKNLTISIMGEDIKLHIDKLRLKQVITNLLSNALKFTDEGFIEINSYRSTKDKGGNDIADSLFISVSDSGQGIPLDNQTLLFSKWEQLGSNRNGTGIGLCLSRFLVEAMGGVIYVNEDYNSNIKGSPGAQFVIQFPIDTILASKKDGTSMHNVPAYTALSSAVKACEKDLQTAPRASNSFAEMNMLTNKSFILGDFSVLIVDDSVTIRKLLRRRVSLMFPESTITEANNGEEAIAFAKSGPQFDIILIDQFMGEGLSGDETIKVLREMNIDSLIFGISGNDKKLHHKLAGAEDFIQKPLPHHALFLTRFLDYLAPPSGLKALIIGSDEAQNQILKSQLYITASPHFTTFEEAEKRMSIEICRTVDEAKSCLEGTGTSFDLVVVDEEFDEIYDEKFGQKHGLKDNAIIALNASSGINRSQNYDVFWSKPLPAVDQMRKSLVVKLIRPRI